MDWLELHIDTTHTGLEPVETMLSALGIDGVVIDDETEFHDFLESNRQYWDYVDENLEASMHGKSRVTFYLPADETGFAQMGEVRLALEDLKARRSDCGTLLLSLENLRDEDWENNWKQYYKPMEIGQRLLVIPQWEQVDPGQRVPLILDPGLTFGTGSHATTRLCLTALEKTVAQGDRVLDLGCGSGILSIAALRLGASRPWRWILTTNAWMWPMRMPPSTASVRTATPYGLATCSPTGLCAGSWKAAMTSWWPTSWRMSSSPWLRWFPPCSVPAAPSCAPASLTTGPKRSAPPWRRRAGPCWKPRAPTAGSPTPAGDNITAPGDCAGRLPQY